MFCGTKRYTVAELSSSIDTEGDIWKFLGFGERSVIGHTGVRLGDCPRPIDRGFAALLPLRRLCRPRPLRRRFACQHVAAVSATTARSRDPEGELQVHSGGLGEWPAADGRSCFVRCGVLYGAMRHVVRRGESRPAQSGTVRGIRSILATSGGLPMRIFTVCSPSPRLTTRCRSPIR